ncbi:MAG: biliverdin-producing heme oxygenase [SAR324 cluster bacterium]|nr:biliverdin-producing heme oxygenase [SAR324 cluster bacterium]
MVTLMDQLKNETRSSHERIEQFPYFKALAEGNLELDSYIAHLRALAVIHGVLEDEVMKTNDPVLGSVWSEKLSKFQWLTQDLRDLDHEYFPDIPVVVDASVELTRKIRLRRLSDPMSLLGYIYVLEGSTLGGAILKKQLSKTFAFQNDQGMSYFAQYGNDKLKHWNLFKQQMNSLQLQEEEHARILKAANELFEGLMPIFAGLHPITKKVSFYNVTSLNPESGNQPIPEDPQEINAALRAGKITWKQFPYYEYRYSTRGEQYTRSDSSWITTLVQYPVERVKQQIRWLGRVLSTRGMPQCLLETHLQNMYNELVKVHPEKKDKYALLLEGATELRKMRQTYFDDKTIEELSEQFEAQVGMEWSRRLKHMGALLVNAVADEKAGITGAVSSIEDWATDPDRFPEIFISAVKNTIQEAKKRAKK